MFYNIINKVKILFITMSSDELAFFHLYLDMYVNLICKSFTFIIENIFMYRYDFEELN